MKILLLQSPYSFIFSEIVKKDIKNKYYSISYNLGDSFLKKGINNIKLWKELNKVDIKQDFNVVFKEILTIDNLYFKFRKKVDNEELTTKEKEHFYRYYKFLEKFLLENKIDKIIMMNDLRWQHAIAIHLAKKLNIKYMVFELGLFRPNTITFDSKGVNYNNSISKEKDFYLNLNGFKKFDYSKIDSEITERKRNIILRT